MTKMGGTRVDHSMAPGGGGRFAALKAKLGAEKGVRNPGGLAAAIGRKKFGAAKFEDMAEKGRKDAEVGAGEE